MGCGKPCDQVYWRGQIRIRRPPFQTLFIPNSTFLETLIIILELDEPLLLHSRFLATTSSSGLPEHLSYYVVLRSRFLASSGLPEHLAGFLPEGDSRLKAASVPTRKGTTT